VSADFGSVRIDELCIRCGRPYSDPPCTKLGHFSLGARLVNKFGSFERRLDLVEKCTREAEHDAQVARVIAKALEAQVRSVADRLSALILEAGERAKRDSENLAAIRTLVEGVVESVETRNREMLTLLSSAVLK
jgi:hypothetical protein